MNFTEESQAEFLFRRLTLVRNMVQNAVTYCGLDNDNVGQFLLENILRIVNEGLRIVENEDNTK